MSIEQYAAEYLEHQSIHQQLGISFEDYTEARLIEDGEKPDPLAALYAGEPTPHQSDAAFAGVPGLVDPHDPEWPSND